MPEKTIDGVTHTITIDIDEEEELKAIAITPKYHMGDHVAAMMTIASSLFSAYVPTDEETTTGHQKYRLRTIEEACDQAAEMYEHMCKKLVKGGYILELPSRENMKKEKSKAGF